MSVKQTIWIASIPQSLIGPLWVAVSEHGLAAVEFTHPQAALPPREAIIQHLRRRFPHAEIEPNEQHTAEACRQISEYLAGQRRTFDLAIDLAGLSAFQQQVLKLTAAIPYGQTVTYAEIAVQMAKPGAARAVGRAEATNPLPLIIPCHRVVGSDGGLHGYGGPGGIHLKARLLEMEREG